jgi:hypothetical protein
MLVHFMDIWPILRPFDIPKLEPFGIFYGKLVYFFPVLVHCTNKNLAILAWSAETCWSTKGILEWIALGCQIHESCRCYKSESCGPFGVDELATSECKYVHKYTHVSNNFKFMTKVVYITLFYLSKIDFQEFCNIIHFLVTTNSHRMTPVQTQN